MSIIPQIILNSIIAGSIYALIALGFNLVYGATKFFNLAHGVLAAIGGYAVFYFANSLGWNIYLSILLGVVIAGFVGYGLDRFVYQPLRNRRATNMVLLVASLGAFTTIQAIIAILFGTQFQIVAQNTPRIFEIAGGTITQTQLFIFLSSIAIMFGLVVMINKTRIGKAIKAISDDEEVSKIVGIDTDKIIGYVFFIGSAIAGLGGIFVAFDTGIQPTMGLSLLLKGVIASIVGGIGNIYGAVLGAFLLGFAENFGIWKISGEWKEAVAFALLIAFLLFRPQGIIKK